MIDSCMNPKQLGAEYQKVLADYECVKAQGLNLNMAHGKPAKLQLDLVSDILTSLQTPEDCLIHTSLFSFALEICRTVWYYEIKKKVSI